jgi:hypothetical protein
MNDEREWDSWPEYAFDDLEDDEDTEENEE